MTTSSQAAAPSEIYDCPTWCVRTDHHADVIDADNLPIHYGPEFGVVVFQGTASHDLLGQIEEREVKDMTVDDLDQLAADCMKAARWLERFADRYDRGEIK